MKAVIVTGPYDKDLLEIIDTSNADLIIGADSGAYLLAEKQITFDLALGDFDSVNTKEYDTLKKYAKNVKKYPETKDYTDTYLAVKEAIKENCEEITIYGGIGSRLDHTFANLNLLKLGNITFINNTTKMYVLDPGTYNIKNNHTYISFFALEDVSSLSLKGFKYEVEDYNLSTNNPLCISNEQEGTVSFTAGLLLVIHQTEL